MLLAKEINNPATPQEKQAALIIRHQELSKKYENEKKDLVFQLLDALTDTSNDDEKSKITVLKEAITQYMKVHPDEAGACNTAIGASLTENRTKLPRHLQYFFALGGQGVFSTFVLPATISCNQSITFSQNAPRQVQLTLNKTQDGAISSILIRQEITQPLETPQNKTPIITVPITFESHISTNPSGSRTIETAYTAGEPAVQVNRIENQARARILKAVFQGGATHSGTLEP